MEMFKAIAWTGIGIVIGLILARIYSYLLLN
jgi:hypothetical protein